MPPEGIYPGPSFYSSPELNALGIGCLMTPCGGVCGSVAGLTLSGGRESGFIIGAIAGIIGLPLLASSYSWLRNKAYQKAIDTHRDKVRQRKQNFQNRQNLEEITQ